MKETEDLLATFDIGDRRKVLLAVWLLKEEAARWWVVTTATRPIETWDDFRGRFGLRFLSLKQGDMTIREYIDKFNQLARVGLDLVNTAQKKALYFALGLNEPLHGLAMTNNSLSINPKDRNQYQIDTQRITLFRQCQNWKSELFRYLQTTDTDQVP